jgi:hypothetical protein
LKKRSNLMGGVRWRCRFWVCGGDEGITIPRACKNPPQSGRKTVLGPSLGGAGAEGEETRGYKNETRLIDVKYLAKLRPDTK